MANPQLENGHLEIANELAEAFFTRRISGREWQIIWVVIRKTWGWVDKKTGKKKKMDVISKSQFHDLTGIPRQKCQELLHGLVERNIILKGVTQKGNIKIVSYGFNKNYETWKVLPKRVTPTQDVTQKGNTLLPKKVTEVLPKKVTTKEKKKTIQKKSTPPIPPHFFDDFWTTYPKKIGKKPCEKKYLSILKKSKAYEITHNEIMIGLENLLENCQNWKDGFVPNPLTFLNQERWKDEPQGNAGRGKYGQA